MSSAFSNKTAKPRLGRAGVSSVEYALIFTAFILSALSVIDLTNYAIVIQSVATVTTEFARFCMVQDGNCAGSGGSSGTWSQLTTLAPLLDATQFNVTMNPVSYIPSGPSAGNPTGMNVMQITVTYPFTPMVPWMSVLAGTVTQSATYFN